MPVTARAQSLVRQAYTIVKCDVAGELADLAEQVAAERRGKRVTKRDVLQALSRVEIAAVCQAAMEALA